MTQFTNHFMGFIDSKGQMWKKVSEKEVFSSLMTLNKIPTIGKADQVLL